VTARSVVRLDAGNRDRKTAHWRAIAIAACEQCGRAKIPAIAEAGSLASRVGVPSGSRLRILLSLDAEASIALAAAGATEIELLVGPEGGLEDAERRAALDAGYRGCRLGPRVLRSETAAIAAIAVLQAIRGDLQ